MTAEEVYTFIPRNITLGALDFKVEVLDEPGEVFGYFKPASAKIVIYTKVTEQASEDDGDMETVELTKDQIWATFLHEVVHAVYDVTGLEQSEQMAQIFSTFLYQVFKSRLN